MELDVDTRYLLQPLEGLSGDPKCEHVLEQQTSNKLVHFCAASLIGSTKTPKWYSAVVLSPIENDLVTG